MKKDAHVHIMCEQPIKEELERLAKEKRMSFSDFIRRIFRKEVESNKGSTNISNLCNEQPE